MGARTADKKGVSMLARAAQVGSAGDARCPRYMTHSGGNSVPGGQVIAPDPYCLALDPPPIASGTVYPKGEVAFAITDGLDGMTFSTSLMLKNNN